MSHDQPEHRPPTFTEARNKRQKVRSAGLHPDYWYPLEYADRIKPGEVVGTAFWGKPVAVWRDVDGEFHAIEDRCAHRQIKLSEGKVKGCRITCPYHGWTYDHLGRLVDVPHELFGHKSPKISVPTYPVRVRYGLVWFFPGDPAKASRVPMPEVPELEGPDRWACVPFDYTWKAHHSMIMDNVCDFTHESLHEGWQPFATPKLTEVREVGDDVHVAYDTQVAAGRIYNLFIDRNKSSADHMRLCYEYPHQWSDTDGKYKHHMFVLPIDERTTRCFFLFYYESLKVPFLPVRIPRALMVPVLKIANRLIMRPLLDEDGWAVEAEQAGYDRYHELPIAEFSPVIKTFQALTIRKWEEYLAERDQQPSMRRLPIAPSALR